MSPRISIRRQSVRKRPSKPPARWVIGFVCSVLLFSPAGVEGESGRIQIPAGAALELGAEVPVTTVADLRLEDGALHLTLDEAILLAMERNVDLLVERYNHQSSLLGVRQSLGIFDLQLGGNLGLDEDSRPRGSTLEAADTLVSESQRFGVNLAQLSPIGGTANFRFDTTRSETSDLRIDPNPVFNLGTNISYTQPLLRGFGRRYTRRNLTIARKNATISREDLQVQVEAILVEVTDAYWGLVEQRERLVVAEEALRNAEELHELNQRKLEAGILAPIEMAQSESAVATRRVDLLERQSAVGNAADRLRQVIHLETGDGAWSLDLVPTFETTVNHRAIDLEEALATALAARPDLKRQRLRNEILEIEARTARNQKLPQLDVTAGYRLNAREGDRFLRDENGLPILDDDEQFIIVPMGFGDAFSQLLDGDFNGWSVNFSWSYPLQNRSARVADTSARIALERGRLALRSLELDVRTDVRRNVREMEAAALRIELARTARELAEDNLEAVQLGYQHGSKSTLDVNQVQEDLSERRNAEINAILNYRRTAIAFYRSIGDLLERYGIALEDGPS